MRVPTSLALAAAVLIASVVPAAAQPAYDQRRPRDVEAMLNDAGAEARLKPDAEDPTILGSWDGKTFGVKFFNCNSAKTLCSLSLYVSGWDIDGITLEELNRWNDFTWVCPAYKDKENSAIMWMGSMAFPSRTRAEAIDEFRFYVQCLNDFEEFLGGGAEQDPPTPGANRT